MPSSFRNSNLNLKYSGFEQDINRVEIQQMVVKIKGAFRQHLLKA